MPVLGSKSMGQARAAVLALRVEGSDLRRFTEGSLTLFAAYVAASYLTQVWS